MNSGWAKAPHWSPLGRVLSPSCSWSLNSFLTLVPPRTSNWRVFRMVCLRLGLCTYLAVTYRNGLRLSFPVSMLQFDLFSNPLRSHQYVANSVHCYLQNKVPVCQDRKLKVTGQKRCGIVGCRQYRWVIWKVQMMKTVSFESNKVYIEDFSISCKGKRINCGMVQGFHAGLMRWCGHWLTMRVSGIRSRIHLNNVDFVNAWGRTNR